MFLETIAASLETVQKVKSWGQDSVDNVHTHTHTQTKVKNELNT